MNEEVMRAFTNTVLDDFENRMGGKLSESERFLYGIGFEHGARWIQQQAMAQLERDINQERAQ